MFAAILAETHRGGFNAPLALMFGPAMVFVGWSAFRNAERESNRIATVLGVSPTRSNRGRVWFRVIGIAFMVIGVAVFCVAVWQLLGA
jgi:hypothetical protein